MPFLADDAVLCSNTSTLPITELAKGVEGVDFWSLAPNHGKIICTSVKKVTPGANWAGIDTTNEWRTADGMKILDEKREKRAEARAKKAAEAKKAMEEAEAQAQAQGEAAPAEEGEKKE